MNITSSLTFLYVDFPGVENALIKNVLNEFIVNYYFGRGLTEHISNSLGA